MFGKDNGNAMMTDEYRHLEKSNMNVKQKCKSENKETSIKGHYKKKIPEESMGRGKTRERLTKEANIKII